MPLGLAANSCARATAAPPTAPPEPSRSQKGSPARSAQCTWASSHSRRPVTFLGQCLRLLQQLLHRMPARCPQQWPAGCCSPLLNSTLLRAQPMCPVPAQGST
jgi:hypothetical protein